MTPEQYAHLREVFVAARAAPEPQRAGFLEQACGPNAGLRAELESLLCDEARATAFLDTPLLGRLLPIDSPDPPGRSPESPLGGPAGGERRLDAAPRTVQHTGLHRDRPERIGPFRILGVLGEGGMGIVYEAEQQRPRRRVALKVLRPGLWSQSALRRFEHESQVLAMLHHPGIAQIYEAGVVDLETGRPGQLPGEAAGHPATLGPSPVPRGVPYFAMELVRGRTLTDHAAAFGQGLRERLELMARVCDAVQHAHQKGVIHRDLKPANILVVDEGSLTAETQRAQREELFLSTLSASAVKVLDFGVARVTDADLQLTTLQTDVGQLIGTLAYMSPEQLAGDSRAIDTRSDVYSLGVILYELLCGQLPYDVTRTSLARAAQVIREEPPRRLSAVDRTLRGDIETIVLKALEKERGRRYPSAAELAQDIRRYLNCEPITARPATLTYQLRKLVARHKAVSTLLGVLLTALVTFSVAVSVLYVRANRDRERAEEAEGNARAQAETATRVAASLMELFGPLDRALWLQGEYAAATQPLRQALAIVLEIHPRSEQAAKAQSLLGAVLMASGDPAAAAPMFEQAAETWRVLRGAAHPETQFATFHRVLALQAAGQSAAVEPLVDEMFTLQQQLLVAGRPDIGSLHNLVLALHAQGDFARAASLVEPVTSLYQHTLSLPEDHPDRSGAPLLLGLLHMGQGDPAVAEPLLREAVDLRTRCLVPGERKWRTAYAESVLGECLTRLRRFDEAEPLLLSAVQTLRHDIGERQQRTFEALQRLVHLYEQWGKPESAGEYRALLPLATSPPE